MEQLKDADQALQKVRQEGQAATEELQATLGKERAAWTQERSSLTTRLEEVMPVVVVVGVVVWQWW